MGLSMAGNGRTYDEFRKHMLEPVVPLFDSLREYCLALGEKVVEDVRMHRVVYGKSISFRWFADMEPQEDGVLIKLQRDRKEEPKAITIKLDQDLTEIKREIKDAYETIH